MGDVFKAYDIRGAYLRASNTEPVMRLNLEANDPSAEEAKKKEVLKIIGEPDLSMTIES